MKILFISFLQAVHLHALYDKIRYFFRLFRHLREKLSRILFKSVYRHIDDLENRNKTLLDIMEYRFGEANNDRIRKKVIYTCISGNYDNLRNHPYIAFDYDYVCFTDNNELLEQKNYGVWKIKPMKANFFNNSKNNRWHKIHPHILFSEYNSSIYIDANIEIKTSHLFDILEKSSDIRIAQHPYRNCIYQEIKAVLHYKRDTEESIKALFEFLKSEQFPKEYGLCENSIIFREHNNSKIIEIMNLWWHMLENYSARDQLSLSYVLWKHDIDPKNILFPATSTDKINYRYYPHNKKK